MNSQMPCPACGSDLQNTSKFCAQCGQPVTASKPESEQSGLGDALAPSHGAGHASADAAQGVNLGQRGKLIAAGVVAAVVLVVVVVAVISSGSSKASSVRDDASVSRQPAGPPPEQRCADLWNSEGNNMDQLVGSKVRFGDVYVAVGFAADYPDKCLVSTAYPSSNESMQFIEAGGTTETAPYTIMGSGTASSLPASAKDWNATITEDGRLTLK